MKKLLLIPLVIVIVAGLIFGGCAKPAPAPTTRPEGPSGRIEGTRKWRFRGRAPSPYQLEQDVLLDAIRRNKPHNEAEYGAISTMTAIMGRMATYSGKMIRWDDAINSRLSLAPKRYAWDAEPPVMPGKDGVYPVAMPGITKAL